MADEKKGPRITDYSSSDFTIIWNDLTHKVDSRPFYTRLKEKCFMKKQSSDDVEISSCDNSIKRNKNPKKTILNQVCGDARSRQLTGILGPSGAGKSTLLSCLFQNRSDGTTGQILVESASGSRLKVCFIPQHDYLNEWLTVREDLIFVSKLKEANFNRTLNDISNNYEQDPASENTYVKQIDNKYNTSLIDHEANATRVADLLGLSNCLDVKIKNISGGQKKRLSIARELMSKPDILILDEPTTGLDSLTCYKTMLVLKDLAHHSANPMAVIVTIHQPPKAVLNLFDKTYFMTKGGRVIYDDDPKKVVSTLENVTKVKLPMPNYNPASFLIEIASDEAYSNIADQLSRHQRAVFHFKYSNIYLTNLKASKRCNGNTNQAWTFCSLKDRGSDFSESSVVQNRLISSQTEPNISLSKSQNDADMINTDDQTTRSSQVFDTNDYFISYQLRKCLASHSTNIFQSFRHVFILTHRSWISIIRNPSLTRSRFLFHIALPFIMLLIYGQGSGGVNNCPKFDSELDIKEMTKDINRGIVARNVNDLRLSVENVAFFFIILYGFAMNTISITSSFYPLTMNMFRKETINGLYSPGPYFIGQMLAELPMEIFYPTSSMILSYYISGQVSSYLEWRMFAISFFVFLTCYAIHAMGLLCGALFMNNITVAVIFGQILLFPSVMFSGFLVRMNRMPDWMAYLTYTSIFRHGLFGIAASRYGFNICDCDQDKLTPSGEIEFVGMAPNVKHVIEYLFPKKNDSNEDFEVTTIFDELGKRFVKAQTFALDIKSCDDVKPFPMHMFSVNDIDLIVSFIGLFSIIALLKILTFSIMKTFPHRIS